MTKDALTTLTSDQSKLDAPKHLARLPLLLILAVASFSLITGTVSWRECSKAASLRRIAREIQLGANIVDVDNRLGKSTIGYGSAIPGAPPTEFGPMYGGADNDFREQVDSLVSRMSRGFPRWYRSQHPRSLPVLVKYDSENRVAAVFVDGVEITFAVRQRTH